jgi:hypothetical protein
MLDASDLLPVGLIRFVQERRSDHTPALSPDEVVDFNPSRSIIVYFALGVLFLTEIMKIPIAFLVIPFYIDPA